ncbi:MAG TPA: sugar phosphate isomerase/epimerase [Gemmatimonadaceae bacterium]|nr:sugar phosphate isomerase/epimerase [Gemmatimonadaceae bacterium]
MRRREFVSSSLGLAALASVSRSVAALPNAPSVVAARITFGYAAITWGGNDLAAIDDIASLGFPGIQLRASAVTRWGDRPSELKELLAASGLTLVALSSGVVALDPANEQATIALHVNHARFVRDVGGLYLQVVDERPRGRAPEPDDFRRMGRLLTEIGRRTADLGVPLGLHNHMGNLSQSPTEVARVLEASDPKFVKLELDVAHYHQAGGKPADAVRRHADRLLFLHIKDVESPAPGGQPGSYRFVELGRGQVDLAGVFASLAAVGFDGWAIVELDSVPDRARTPKASGEIAKQYLRSLGMSIGAASRSR